MGNSHVYIWRIIVIKKAIFFAEFFLFALNISPRVKFAGYGKYLIIYSIEQSWIKNALKHEREKTFQKNIWLIKKKLNDMKLSKCFYRKGRINFKKNRCIFWKTQQTLKLLFFIKWFTELLSECFMLIFMLIL